jgi:hypothetical protein
MASKAETIRSIRAEWLEETEEDPGQTKAEYMLDQMCEAFFQISEGVGLAGAVHRDRRTAEYLKWQWTGDDGRRLRTIMEIIDSGDCDCDQTPQCRKNAEAKKASAAIANRPGR